MKTQATEEAVLAQRVARWFKNNARTLPWRFSSNPYAIWVSEIMLQQTRVDTVIPRFNSFMDRFPTVTDLANADLNEVRSEWAGLGYYRRCQNLWRGAQYVRDELQGALPTTREEWSQIPGIGPYTSAAIAALAFHIPVAAVDGNVLRVLGRVLGKSLPITSNQLRRDVQVFGDSLVQHGDPSILTQALMEIGALLCQPTSTQCPTCPLAMKCEARKMDNPTSIPYPAKRKEPARWGGVVVVAVDQNDRILLERRPEKGVLAGLWMPPSQIGPVKDRKIREAMGDPSQIAKTLLERPLGKMDTTTTATWRFTHILLEPIVIKTRHTALKPKANQALKSMTEWSTEAVPSATFALLASVGIKAPSKMDTFGELSP